MGCPVHIWVPMMAALAPFGRMARDRLLASKPARAAARPTREVRTLQRFAPVAPVTAGGESAAASTSEQAR